MIQTMIDEIREALKRDGPPLGLYLLFCVCIGILAAVFILSFIIGKAL